MKNLKRVLSFALATAMLVGMMVVGAGAAEFTDGDAIQNADAVNTLVALNVINGKDDGSFAPTEVVSRAQMAKMITVALNGGKAPTLPTNAKPTYTDIGGHWAQAYIEYCAGLGIVSGRGDGTFDPEGTVTGSEAAKMMLVAMGYPSDVYGFTGAAWAINVGIEANKAELFEGIEDIDTGAGLTRDNTAQLIYNGVLAKTMTKNPAQVVGGSITWNYYLDGPSIYNDKFKGKTLTGTFEGNENNTAAKEGEICVAGVCFPAEFDISYIGEEVDVLYKEGKESVRNGLDRNDVIYGIIPTGKTSVMYATLGDINKTYKETGKVEIAEEEYTVAAAANNIYESYKDTKTVVAKASIETLGNANGDTVKFILNEDGEIMGAYVVKSTLTDVTAVSSTKISLRGVGTLTIEDHAIAEGLEKEDVVVVTTLYAGDKTLHVVEKAEVISGTVDSFKGTESVTVDGTKYSIYNKGLKTVGSVATETAFTTTHIGETFDLFMVNGYVYAAEQTSESASNYSLIVAASTGTIGDTFDPFKIQVLGSDGVKTTLILNDKSTAKTGSNYKAGEIVTWTGSADDATVKIATTASGNYTAKTKSVGGMTVATDAVLYANTSGTTYKAYNLRDLDDVTGLNYVAKDNKIVAAYYVGTPEGASAETVYGIVSAYHGVVKIDDDFFASYTIENNAETFEVYAATDDSNLAKGKIVSFEVSSNNQYAKGDFTVLPAAKSNAFVGYVDNLNEADNTLTYFEKVTVDKDGKATETNPHTYALADDCVILYVNVEDDCAGTDIGVNGYNATDAKANVIVVTNGKAGDEDVIAIIVETSGKEDIATVL